MKTFRGYHRKDSRPGVRNYIAVLATVSCANTVVQKIASHSKLAIPITHDCGCLQFGDDKELTIRTIKGMALHPNAGAVIVVGLGCEYIDALTLSDSIDQRPCAGVVIQKAGGTTAAVNEGVELLKTFESLLKNAEKEEFPISELIVGVKCGGSDFTNAIASNPALGKSMDHLVAAGGTVLLTETPGFPGSERILADRAVSEDVARQIWDIVDIYRNEVKSRFDLSIHDENPSPGNIAGGITTLIEKSLGNIKKGGSSPIQGVLRFGEPVGDKKGLWIMETPGHDVFSVSGAAAGGAQIIAWTTGRGTPLGCALIPMIKICASPKTVRFMAENIDIDISGIMNGSVTLIKSGEIIFDALGNIASGQLTASETLEHFEFSIPRTCRTL